MPIELPDLDTKTYKDISDEMIASIPKYSKKWTNHNPSDPGIAILELLSWVEETTLYRINRIPDDSYVNFLRLVAGASGVDEVEHLLKDPYLDRSHKNVLEFLKEIETGHKKDVSQVRTEALKFLMSRYRAVTDDDFCALAIEATDTFEVKVKRAIIEKAKDKENIEIIIVPERWEEYEGLPESNKRDSYARLVGCVNDYLSPRTLIGTKIEVKQPVFTDVSINMKVICQHSANPEKVEKEINAGIKKQFDPFIGGENKTGWPYRRSITVYEIAQIVERTQGVKELDRIRIDGEEIRIRPIEGLVKLSGLDIEVVKEGR